MGLDASVMCNCFREGHTRKPPVPREWLQIDDEGYLGLKPEHDSNAAWARLHRWLQTCCDHVEMVHTREAIANWAGYRLFQQALSKLGIDSFPTLRDTLPDVNGGRTEPSDSERALRELEAFRESGLIGSKTCLVASATGEALYDCIDAYHGIFIMDGRSGVDAGFDLDGFFLRDRESKAELFRASRFRQTMREPERLLLSLDPGRVIFENLDTGSTFECRTVISGEPIPWPDGRMQDKQGRYRFEHPREFHVEERTEMSSEHYYLIEPLERVFRASVAMNNPVRWC